jgi:hypothetical protein
LEPIEQRKRGSICTSCPCLQKKIKI